MTKTILNIVLLLISLILVAHFIWGIPAEIADRSSMEGWVDDTDRISKELSNARLKNGIPIVFVISLLAFNIKRKAK
ncbi:MAG: hypothetical protein ACOVP1_14130 [Bacteroidia bacterium]